MWTADRTGSVTKALKQDYTCHSSGHSFLIVDSLFSADLASRHIHAWHGENHKIRPNRKGGIGGYSNENAHVWLTRDAHNGSKRQHD